MHCCHGHMEARPDVKDMFGNLKACCPVSLGQLAFAFAFGLDEIYFASQPGQSEFNSHRIFFGFRSRNSEGN